MRIILAIISFVLAAVFLCYFGLASFGFVASIYENYPIDLSDVVWTPEFYAFLAITGVSLVLGLGFLFAGISAVSSKPRRQQ